MTPAANFRRSEKPLAETLRGPRCATCNRPPHSPDDDPAALRGMLRAERQWIHAKCTIGGCWRDMFLKADRELRQIAVLTIDELIRSEKERREHG